MILEGGSSDQELLGMREVGVEEVPAGLSVADVEVVGECFVVDIGE